MVHEEMMGILSGKNPCADPPGMSFPDTNPETIDPEQSEGITVEGGLPPFTWSVTGIGFTLDHAETQDRNNTLNAAAAAGGAGVITCTDRCSTEATWGIRCSNGEWVLKTEDVCEFSRVYTGIELGPSPLRWIIVWSDYGNKRQKHRQDATTPAVGCCPADCVQWCIDNVYSYNPCVINPYTVPCLGTGPDEHQCWGLSALQYFEWQEICLGHRSPTNTYCYCSNASLGGPWYNVEDGNIGTNIQNFSYVACHFLEEGHKTRTDVRLYIINSSARDNLLGANIMGSNNSTNGVDGDWTNLLDITSELLGPETSGWSYWMELSNQAPYRWYRLSGCPQNTNTVLPEWEWQE